MKITVVDKIDISVPLRQVESDAFWLFAAKEWNRLISPYVPRREGQLMQNVEIKPKSITYKGPYKEPYKKSYAAYQYYGELYVDPKYGKGGFTSDGGKTFWSRPGVKKVPSGRYMKLRTNKNLKASREWDKAAIKDKQDLLLAQSMQKWIDRNL